MSSRYRSSRGRPCPSSDGSARGRGEVTRRTPLVGVESRVGAGAVVSIGVGPEGMASGDPLEREVALPEDTALPHHRRPIYDGCLDA